MLQIFLIIGISLIFIAIAMKLAYRIYPVEPLRAGTQVNVYMDGRHNRTATISHNLPKAIVIYDKLPLPIHYRGKFYAVGYTDDSHRLMFIGRKRLFFFARVAELIRKIVNTPEYDDTTIELDVEVKIESLESDDEI